MPLQRHLNRIPAAPWPALAAALSLAAAAASAQSAYDSDWTRNFRIGFLAGFNLKANFAMSGNFGVSGAQPGPVGVIGANHVFTDGYVKPDITGGSDLTWNWGINNASQWDQANNRLLMHGTENFNTSGTASGEDAAALGFELAYGGVLWHPNRFRVGWEFGFGLLPINITDNSTLSATIRNSTYAFNTGGIDLSTITPNLPYRGTLQGPGPEIQNQATLLSTTTQKALLTGTRTLDVTLYTFKLGPTLFYDLSPYVGVQIGGGPALGLVSGNLKYNEVLSNAAGTTPNTGEIGATEVTYGGYINAVITFHTVKNGDFYLGAQYMPMGSVRVSGSGRQADLKLDGQVYLSAGLSWPF